MTEVPQNNLEKCPKITYKTPISVVPDRSGQPIKNLNQVASIKMRGLR